MKTGSLWQLSVAVSPEAADAAAFRLQELFHVPASIYTQAQTQRTTATVYLPRLPGSARALRAQIASVLGGLPRIGDLGAGRVRIKRMGRENWAESWKRHFKPIEIGGALLIRPSWSRRRPRPGQAVVVLDPGLSFGTGQHATTRFCLQRIAACRRRAKRQSLLDIGSGSGILAIAAAKLGYEPVEAFDFDPDTVRIARENARRNKVKIALRHQDLVKLPLHCRKRYDVICANLIYDLLVAEAEKICRRLKPQGQLIVAGILRSQFAAVQNAFARQRLKPVAGGSEKEWQSGQFTFGG